MTSRRSAPDGPPPAEFLTISELSARSGVPVASIKFYLRQGLMASGDPSRPGRAYYDASHLRRLGVIRALRDVGRLPVAVIRRVLRTLERPGADAIDVIAPAIDALSPRGGRETPALRQARAEIDAMLEREGVSVRPNAAAKRDLARALVALRSVAPGFGTDALAPYVKAARAIAADEIGRGVAEDIYGDTARALELAVLATVLHEPVILALRRLFHEHLTGEVLRARPAARAR